MTLRAVLDTNVLVAGLSSKRGASHVLLRRGFDGCFRVLASPPLWLEYEAVLKQPRIAAMHGLDAQGVDDFLDALATVVEAVHIRYLWRPRLNDPKDEMVFETAMNGRADVLVTFNRADFTSAMQLFSPSLWTPGEFLSLLENRDAPNFR
jgi:putative PIN family toxin of toxin-antitoxin system